MTCLIQQISTEVARDPASAAGFSFWGNGFFRVLRLRAAGSPEIYATFKGIFGDDISEFYMAQPRSAVSVRAVIDTMLLICGERTGHSGIRQRERGVSSLAVPSPAARAGPMRPKVNA